MTLEKPVRMYKRAYGNNSIRGRDLKGIGDGHALEDRPLFVEGAVKVVEQTQQRIKVKVNARAEVGGSLYSLTGWIEKDGAG